MDRQFLKQAIQLAKDNVRRNGGPFGAVVVRGGVVIAAGANQVTRANDPTAHAEVVAIREACRVLGSFQLAGCDVYTSCEPCPMCLGALYWARPDRVFFAATQDDAEHDRGAGRSDEGTRLRCQPTDCRERRAEPISDSPFRHA